MEKSYSIFELIDIVASKFELEPEWINIIKNFLLNKIENHSLLLAKLNGELKIKEELKPKSKYGLTKYSDLKDKIRLELENVLLTFNGTFLHLSFWSSNEYNDIIFNLSNVKKKLLSIDGDFSLVSEDSLYKFSFKYNGHIMISEYKKGVPQLSQEYSVFSYGVINYLYDADDVIIDIIHTNSVDELNVIQNGLSLHAFDDYHI